MKPIDRPSTGITDYSPVFPTAIVNITMNNIANWRPRCGVSGIFRSGIGAGNDMGAMSG
jgi:hypothetical protein